jgi:hypothetical protein
MDISDFNPEYVSHLYTEDLGVKYKFRARIVGNLEYTCPFCGSLNRQTARPTHWVYNCLNNECRRPLGIGLNGYLLDRGPKVAPPDIVIPRNLQEVFPQGDLKRWRTGQPIHTVAVLAWLAEER